VPLFKRNRSVLSATTAFSSTNEFLLPLHHNVPALKRAQEASVSSDLSTDSEVPDNNNNGQTVASPASMSTPFPLPGQGVVPLNYNSPVGLSQGDSQKKSRSRGLSLSGLAQQQGWTEQDYKRIYSAELMAADPNNSAGYGSAPKTETA